MCIPCIEYSVPGVACVGVNVSVSCRCNLVKNKQMSTNEYNLRIADDGGGDIDVGVSQRSEQSVSLATIIVGRPLPTPLPPEQILLCFAFADADDASFVGDCGAESFVVRDLDTLRHRRKLRNEKRRRNSSNGLSASALRTLVPAPPSELLSDENNAFVGGTIKLFDLCLRFCFFDFDDDDDDGTGNGDGGGDSDPVGDMAHDSALGSTFLLLLLRRKLIVVVFDSRFL